MQRVAFLAVASMAFVGCDSSSSNGSEPAPSPSPSAALVVDSVKGVWIVGSGAFEGDTVRIDADSLAWSGSAFLGLGPTRFGARFYARGGLMGLTNGQSQDNVSFEYLRAGDTLWLELQNLAMRPVDGRVDRSLSSTHPLLPATR
jgi:hypothetical protein